MKKTRAQIMAENREGGQMPGMTGSEVVDTLTQIRRDELPVLVISMGETIAEVLRTIKDVRTKTGESYDLLMTNAEKQKLTACPFCGVDYGQGFSEVDADENCRVTCGFCGRYIEYKIVFVR